MCAHVQGWHWGWLLSLLWYSLLVSMEPVATHACFSESHWDCFFHPQPGRQPRSCRHLFIFWCVRVCMASQRETIRDIHTHAHTCSHMGRGDHVGCHRMSLNPRMSPDQLALWGNKDGPSAASGDTPGLAIPKAPGKCEGQLPWPWCCTLTPSPRTSHCTASGHAWVTAPLKLAVG